MIWGFEFRKKLDPVTGADVGVLDIDFWHNLIQGPNKFDVSISERSKERTGWIERECNSE
jgi:hypothetical protein